MNENRDALVANGAIVGSLKRWPVDKLAGYSPGGFTVGEKRLMCNGLAGCCELPGSEFAARLLLVVLGAIGWVCQTTRADLPSDDDVQWIAARTRPMVAVRAVGDREIEFDVPRVPDDRKLHLPRLNNPVAAVTERSETPGGATVPLAVTPEVDHWVVKLSDDLSGPAKVRIRWVGPFHTVQNARPIQRGTDGELVLPAHRAVTHGRLLRYEPQPHKNTVGYWADEHDWVHWNVHVAAAGRYSIVIRQGCGTGHGGSRVAFCVGRQRVEFEVVDTGGFQSWVDRPVGELTLTGGLHQCALRAMIKSKGAVMDVQEIRLVPSDQGE